MSVSTNEQLSPEQTASNNNNYNNNNNNNNNTVVCVQVSKQPLFTGDSEIDQLFHVFRLLGTPNERSWPGCTELPDFKDIFPKWPCKDLPQHLPLMHSDALDLLTVCWQVAG